MRVKFQTSQLIHFRLTRAFISQLFQESAISKFQAKKATTTVLPAFLLHRSILPIFEDLVMQLVCRWSNLSLTGAVLSLAGATFLENPRENNIPSTS